MNFLEHLKKVSLHFSQHTFKHCGIMAEAIIPSLNNELLGVRVLVTSELGNEFLTIEAVHFIDSETRGVKEYLPSVANVEIEITDSNQAVLFVETYANCMYELSKLKFKKL